MTYTPIRQIGMGGFGVVEKVVDELGLSFARKTYRLSPFFAFDAVMEDTSRKRFIKEAKYQSLLEHKNIVPVIDSILLGQDPFIIMPLAEASLNDDIISGVASRHNFKEIIEDIMAGLEDIHKIGIFHRDLKPSNILRFKSTVDGQRDYYAISDFGLMSMKETSVTTLTATGSTRNSDTYTAPEITVDLKSASIQSDIFSLGCLLHDLVGNNRSRIPCAEINDSCEYGMILSACTKVDPSRRFKSIRSLRDTLATIEVQVAQPSTEAGTEILELLNKTPDNLSEADFQNISVYVSSHPSIADKAIILKKITLEHIDRLNQFPNEFRVIALAYAQWLRRAVVPWEECDSYCVRMMRFINLAGVEVQSEGIMALLYLGTSHNRYYVERKIFRFLVQNCPPNLITRIGMEIRIDGDQAKSAFEHLAKSIDVDLLNLPAQLQKALDML